MIDFNNVFNLLNIQDIVGFFFKTFSVLFSFLYLIYAIVILKQTQVMTKTIESGSSSLILLVSLLQIGIGLVLVFISLVLI